ncbi:MAG: hypothetical protein ACOYI4_07255, partial [Christensenellales bacterium]
HSAAAGLTMDYSQLAEFCSGLNAQLQEMAPEAFIPCITYDTTLRIQDINPQLADDIERLAPFGQGNHQPRFLISKVSFQNVQSVGKNGNHLKLVMQQGGCGVDGVAFGQGRAREAFSGWEFDVVAGVENNRWNGTVRPQCKIRRFKLAQQVETLPKDKFLDAFLSYLIYNNKDRVISRPLPLQQWERELDDLPLWVEGSAILCGSPKSAEFALKALKKRGIDRFWNNSIGRPATVVPYNALVIAPQPGVDYSAYTRVFALDCFFSPAPYAQCFVSAPKDLADFLDRAVLGREQLAKIYPRVLGTLAHGRRLYSKDALFSALESGPEPVSAYALSFALAVFEELAFLETRGAKVALLPRRPGEKKNLEESLTYRTAWEIREKFLGKREH